MRRWHVTTNGLCKWEWQELVILLNEGTANACANYSGPAAFVAGSSSNCAAGSFLLPADGGGIDDSTGVVSNQQVNAVCASNTCVLTVKSY